MFGRGDQIEALQAQVAQLQAQVERLALENATIRPLLDDTLRLRDLAAEADRLRQSAETALAALRQLSATEHVAQERYTVDFNLVYQAECTGYVSAYFDSGFTDTVQLLVGPSDPPTERVCEANTGNDINSYAGTVVRKGEYWMVKSKRGARSGFMCVFTPLF